MPLDYTVDAGKKIISIIGTGHVSMEERYDCVNRVLHDGSIADKHHVLIDVSHVSNMPSAGDMDSIVTLVKILQTKFGGRVAILNAHIGHVTITNLITLSADSKPDKVRAFMLENEALEWLNAKT